MPWAHYSRTCHLSDFVMNRILNFAFGLGPLPSHVCRTLVFKFCMPRFFRWRVPVALEAPTTPNKLQVVWCWFWFTQARRTINGQPGLGSSGEPLSPPPISLKHLNQSAVVFQWVTDTLSMEQISSVVSFVLRPFFTLISQRLHIMIFLLILHVCFNKTWPLMCNRIHRRNWKISQNKHLHK